MTDCPNGLRSERDDLATKCEARWRAFSQFQRRQGTQDDPNLLDAAAQQFFELLLIFWRDINSRRGTAHTRSMRQNKST